MIGLRTSKLIGKKVTKRDALRDIGKFLLCLAMVGAVIAFTHYCSSWMTELIVRSMMR